jgi:hypothetical protein
MYCISFYPGKQILMNIAIGCTSLESLTMTSECDSDAEVGTISITGPNASEFKVQNDTCSSCVLEPSEICTFDVVFGPESLGSKEATLSVTFNSPVNKTVEIPLIGLVTEVW